MNLDYGKLGLAAGWILIIVASALLARLGSSTAWFAVGVVALAPCVIALHFWQGVPQTTSERIHHARR